MTLLVEIENSKADIDDDCHKMQNKFDPSFQKIINDFFSIRPDKNAIRNLQTKVLNEVKGSCYHQYVEDDIECNSHITYCIICGSSKDD